MTENTLSVLAKVSEHDLIQFPYPHLNIPSCLELNHYEQLSANYPPFTLFDGRDEFLNQYTQIITSDNWRQLYAYDEQIKQQNIAIYDFVSYHSSREFYLDMIRVFGAAIRARYPFLEERLGIIFEEATLGIRGDEVITDISIECQIGFNPPVIDGPSIIRGPHVDKSRRLLSGLLYLKMPDDTGEGANLAICKFKKRKRLLFKKRKRFSKNYGILTKNIEVINVVPYEANRLVFFLNSDESIHAVTPRYDTPWPRRYFSFFIETAEPLFSIY